MVTEGYKDGYNAAYAEIYTALDDLGHPRHCAGCRPCEVMKSVIEWTMQGLGPLLTGEEFNTLAGIMASARDRRRGSKGDRRGGLGHLIYVDGWFGMPLTELTDLGSWLLERVIEGLRLSANICILLGSLVIVQALTTRWVAPLSRWTESVKLRVEAWAGRNWGNLVLFGAVLILLSLLLLWGLPTM